MTQSFPNQCRHFLFLCCASLRLPDTIIGSLFPLLHVNVKIWVTDPIFQRLYISYILPDGNEPSLTAWFLFFLVPLPCLPSAELVIQNPTREREATCTGLKEFLSPVPVRCRMMVRQRLKPSKHRSRRRRGSDTCGNQGLKQNWALVHTINVTGSFSNVNVTDGQAVLISSHISFLMGGTPFLSSCCV